MADQLNLPRGTCGFCGKVIPVRSVRGSKTSFCNRVHASMAKYGTRYRGTMAGPADRPDFDKKSTEL